MDNCCAGGCSGAGAGSDLAGDVRDGNWNAGPSDGGKGGASIGALGRVGGCFLKMCLMYSSGSLNVSPQSSQGTRILCDHIMWTFRKVLLQSKSETQ